MLIIANFYQFRMQQNAWLSSCLWGGKKCLLGVVTLDIP
jgi:hypothetical protein